MNSFIGKLDGLYDRLFHLGLTLLSLIASIACAGAIMWDPEIFASAIGGFTLFKASIIIWASCSGLIHGVGFKPHFWLWQLLFFPPIAWVNFGLISAWLVF